MATGAAAAQRIYRAACPNCGAPVEFQSAASPYAVCSFCRSTVVRDGDALRKIGESAELFDDHSPLQLGATGRHLGAPFTLIGRLQYRYADGTWNEWHALFDAGVGEPAAQKSGWLSEDNGRYVMAFDVPLDAPVPGPTALVPGASVVVGGQGWTVASVTQAALIAAQGELPVPPPLGRSFAVADLRSTRGEVGTLEHADPAAPRWSIGRAVALAELALTGLAEAGEKTLAGRSLACPNCGAALEVRLASTQSIVCRQCHAVIDVSQGVGGELHHYAQGNGMAPQIPLGRVGTIAFGGSVALPWQVVGYAERIEVGDADPGGDGDGDEQAAWREYLLYNRLQGFAFIVDAQDGWSWSAPITGVPERFGDSVKHEGVLYRKLYDYRGRATHVLGEFYWRLQRDQLTDNTDYQGSGGAAAKRLNRERTRSGDTEEIVWSAGETLSADTVMQTFQLGAEQGAALQRDALPTSLNASSLLAKLFFAGFVIVVVLMLFRCTGGGGSGDCDDTRATFGEASREYQNCLANSRGRTGGGSFGGFSTGGYSSGGSHK